MSKRDIHVVQRSSGWATKKEGSSRAGSILPTQKIAIERAKTQAQRERVEVVIHGRNGKIRDSDSYGSDPNSPKDRKF